MKKLIIIGALCLLSSHLYATPSLNPNAYTQLQSEGSFFTTQADFESYVPFQTTNTTRRNTSISKTIRTQWAGMITTSVGLGLMLGGGILLGLGAPYNYEYSSSRASANSLVLFGSTFMGIGTLATIAGAIAWGVGANQMRSAMLDR